MQPDQELLRKWEVRAAGRVYSRLEIGHDGLVLGAGTVLAKRGDAWGRLYLAIDEQQVMALLAIAYGRPTAPHVLQKIRRAADLWSEGEKALAHFHLAYADLPACGEDETLGLFLAEELSFRRHDARRADEGARF